MGFPWSTLILLAIHLGAEEALALFPNLPAWLVVILQAIAGAKAAARSLPVAEGKTLLVTARADALREVHMRCSGGVGCPPELQANR